MQTREKFTLILSICQQNENTTSPSDHTANSLKPRKKNELNQLLFIHLHFQTLADFNVEKTWSGEGMVNIPSVISVIAG